MNYAVACKPWSFEVFYFIFVNKEECLVFVWVFSFVCLIFLLLLFVSVDRVSMCSPGYPETCYVEQAGLRLIKTCLPQPSKCGSKAVHHQNYLGFLVSDHSLEGSVVTGLRSWAIAKWEELRNNTVVGGGGCVLHLMVGRIQSRDHVSPLQSYPSDLHSSS